MNNTHFTTRCNWFLCRCSLTVLMLIMIGWTQPTVAQTNAMTVSGTVISEADRAPLVGVTVRVKTANVGTVTDLNGAFSIQTAMGQSLIFSYIGHKTKEVTVIETSMQVVLEESDKTLDEVVVIGYGTIKKKLNTGATVQVKGDDLLRQNTSNPLHALQGSTPGVQITSTSGQPGKGVNVTIRGLGSIYGGNPIYIVDGVQTGDISYLNNNDIATIDVLKDAASAAIYGAQASNGVVLITTKSGTKGKGQVTFDAYYGIQNLANKRLDLLDAGQYATMMNEQAVNSGKPRLYSDKSTFLAKYGNTDWLDAIVVDNAPTYNYSLGFNGGSDNHLYAMSLGLTGQDGIIGGHDVSNYQRMTFKANNEYSMMDGLLKVGEHLTFMNSNNTGINEGGIYSGSPIRASLGTSPFLPMFDDNGEYLNNSPKSSYYNGAVWVPWAEGEANPYATMNMGESHGNNIRLLGDVYAELKPIKGLTLKTVFGLETYANSSRAFMPVYKLSAYTYNNNDYATQNLSKGRTWSWENTASYAMTLGDHAFSALVGTSLREYQGEWMYTRNADLIIADYDHAWINDATNVSATNLWDFQGGPSDESMMMSYFGRLNYNYKETYLLNLTLRADGSSHFAKGHRWGYFPSFSAGWVMTNEAFMEDLTWLDFLKARASWGQVGNQNISAWQYLATVQTSNTYYYYGAGVPQGSLIAPGSKINQVGAFPNQLANEELKWETSEQTNIGFDARLLRSRLGVNLDLYSKVTKDWLIKAPVLATTGADAPFINGGDVTNKGIELALSWNDRIGDFTYNAAINGSYNKNTVGNIPTQDGIIHGESNEAYNNAEAIYRRAQEGYPIGYFWGWQTDGILQDNAEVTSYVASLGGNPSNTLQGRNIAPGDVRFVDRDKNGKIEEADKTMIGSPHPDFTFGLSFGCSWKNIDFSIMANGMAGNEIFQSYRDYSSKYANFSTDILGRWHGKGTSNSLPRLTEGNYNYRISDLFVKKGDFLRISNIQVGYDFAKELVKWKYLSQLRFYVAVQNAFILSAYNGMDPEIGYGTDSSNSGIDLGYYPRPRTLLAGVNITF